MKLIPETSDPQRYIECTEYVDFDKEGVRELAGRLFSNRAGDVDKIRTVFEYLQANVPHTFNTDRKEVARSASDVLRLGHGICYAKANLAAALLRSAGIPAGFCYQKFRRDDMPDSKFVIHCLNTVFLKDAGKWVRMDVRNVTEGCDPGFKPEGDPGVFAPDRTSGEEDYPGVYVRPHPATIEALENSGNAEELREKLPQSL